MLPLYRKKTNFIYTFHPLALAVYIFAVFLLALLYTHPLYLFLILTATGMMLIGSENGRQWKGYLRYTIPLMLMLIVINGIFVKSGVTVLYRGPSLPLLGKVRITLEAIAYGGGMGLRLVVIISIFCLFTYTVQPDRLMKSFSRYGNKTVFVFTMAMRLFPLLVSDARRIMEVQQCRGVKFETKGFKKKMINLMPITSVLLLSSLERSFQQAESMYARGYGSGRRTVYKKEIWRPRDVILVGASIAAVIFGIVIYIFGFGTYDYYPKLLGIKYRDFWAVMVIFILLSIPSMMNWGWQKWPKLKSKI